MAGSLPNIILKRFAARSLSKPDCKLVLPCLHGHLIRHCACLILPLAQFPYPRVDFRKLGGSLYNYGLRFSTTAPNDPDTHDDFKPTNKLENSGISLKDVVEQDVKDNPIMVYMKGVPEFPQCGFSSLAVKVLQQYNVPFSARNILEDAELKGAVKVFSNWPTFPQIFIKGEFVGGSDIILNMHQNGELKDLLKDVSSKK